jgi:homogentisate 1,2-dioxygenase
MPTYQQRGRLPRKRHVAFRREDGGLYPEELVGNKGFAGASSLLYHLRLPTAVKSVRPFRELAWEAEEPGPLRHRHLRSGRVETGPSPVLDRVPLLWNDDVALSIVRPSVPEDLLYRNAQADELVYVSEGEGVLESAFGQLAFRDGDYLVVPRGIVHRYRVAPRAARFLVLESKGEVRLPKRYRNEHGQLLEGAPFSERDIRAPGELRTIDETGEFAVLVKSRNRLTEVVLAHHPFDVVGWDGCYYPWAFNIHDFEPKVARVHLPPPVHQTFEGDGWVVCSFCPRPYDFDEDAVPAPYNHQNVMSDEVLYYASAQFMSRKGIEVGSITLHPDGLPHGPQPGKAEESIGKTWTDELAVMLDTFRPLRVGRAALATEDPAYMTSWLEGPSA